MKKPILFLFVFITTSLVTIAQKQTLVYCKITISDVIFHGKIKSQQIEVDYGTSTSSLWTSDTAAIIKLNKAKSMTNIIDAMNYMNSIGWELITVTQRTDEYTCFYKKELDK